jgi:uncharacterized membrane protein YuzA (DUF378 family)
VQEELMRKTDLVALALVVVGALNWGLVALARFDLVAAIFGLDFGETNAATRVIYGLVGLSGVWLVVRARTLLSRRDGRLETVTA